MKGLGFSFFFMTAIKKKDVARSPSQPGIDQHEPIEKVIDDRKIWMMLIFIQ